MSLLILATIAAGSIQSPTVPAGSARGGLVRSPNPIDASSNLAVTGNVAGGKHFRGDIPYGSTSAFGAPLGSTSLDSFRRYSAVPQTRTSYPQNYTPYYSSTGTVTTTAPGYQGVFSPSSPRIVGSLDPSVSQPMDLTTSADSSIPLISPKGADAGVGSAATGLPQLPYGPMPGVSSEIKSNVTNGPGSLLSEPPLSPTGDPLMTPDEYQRRLEQLRQGIERLQGKGEQTEQSLSIDTRTTLAQTTGPQSLQQSLQEPGQLSPPATPDQELETVFPPGMTSAEGQEQAASPSNPNLELYNPSAVAVNPQPGLGATQGETGQIGAPLSNSAVGQAAEPVKLPALQRIEEKTRELDAAAKVANRLPSSQSDAASIEDRLRNASKRAAAQEDGEPDPAGAQPEALQQSPAGQPQPSKDSGSITQDQFNHYLAIGRLCLQQRRYDRAADSFTLAAVYLPRDPQAHLGKSHALLGAGKYVESAASLARAVEIDARCATRKVDLVEILGGPDPFVERISNLEEQAQTGENASQLQLLLAYVYFEMGRIEEARTAIQAVKPSPAVNAFAAAIDRATTK